MWKERDAGANYNKKMERFGRQLHNTNNMQKERGNYATSAGKRSAGRAASGGAQLTEELRQWRRSQEQSELVAGETDERRAQYRVQLCVLWAGECTAFKNNSLKLGGRIADIQ